MRLKKFHIVRDARRTARGKGPNIEARVLLQEIGIVAAKRFVSFLVLKVKNIHKCPGPQLECGLQVRLKLIIQHKTHTGCGAICPSFNRGCYGCYGPAAQPNLVSLTTEFAATGVPREQVVRSLRSFNGYADEFRRESERLEESS